MKEFTNVAGNVTSFAGNVNFLFPSWISCTGAWFELQCNIVNSCLLICTWVTSWIQEILLAVTIRTSSVCPLSSSPLHAGANIQLINGLKMMKYHLLLAVHSSSPSIGCNIGVQKWRSPSTKQSTQCEYSNALIAISTELLPRKRHNHGENHPDIDPLDVRGGQDRLGDSNKACLKNSDYFKCKMRVLLTKMFFKRSRLMFFLLTY